MSIPSWVGEVVQAATPPADSVSFPLHSGRGVWRPVGQRFSCIHNPAYPPDPAVLDAIKEFWPTGIYMQRQWVYLHPVTEQPVLFVRHAFGERVWTPHAQRKPFPVDMPIDADFPAPNMIAFTWRGPEDPALPAHVGTYLPLDWTAYSYMRFIYDDRRSPTERYRQTIEKQEEARLRAEESAADDLAYVHREFSRYAERRLSELSDVEIEEERRKLYAARQQQELDLLSEAAARESSKPLRLYLGG